ncbi:MAG TPA: amylo-alpha-1,6-glucosidase [Gaiellaceae bacterium]|nr:amylo-alpha-1,6-glucosidase [Gaiellaceae bacterium]
MTIAFGPEACGTLEESAQREWLVADGVGGYAMGTVSGLRTRRYHGLLAVAVDGPANRMLGLAALDAAIVSGDARFRLATDEWGNGTVDPRGHELLVSFELRDGVPRWRWQIGGTVLEREIAMTHGAPVVAVVHRLVSADRPVRLELTPLCTWRSVHGERRGNGAPRVEQTADGFVFEGAYRVRGDGFSVGGSWYRDVRAREEEARGLNATEDLWGAGTFAAELDPGDIHEVTAAATSAGGLPDRATAIVATARRRAGDLVRQAGAADETTGQLVLAADQFAITTGGRPTAVAGYPWFGEWSRDLMTSYEGLYLTTRRYDEGREVLRTSATTVSEGMLANTADTGFLEYNTVDGTLWFVHAVGRHVEVTGDDDLGAELAPTLEEIVRRHVDGTRYGIRVDAADGLLTQGADGLALTWMDARVDGVPVTQRAGKPVEVNALWLRALDVVPGFESLRDTAASSFARRFDRADGAGLFDVVDGPQGDDAAVRPNQLLAVSLPNGPLGPQTARAVVETCRRSLLTPLGLRSLAPDDPRYRPYHRGAPADRDGAYHEGTVWPWLIGPYVDAARAAGLPLDGVLDGLDAHLADWGLGSVSETADGAPPHLATGCPFQAWSVAELLRVRTAP